jgi:repressor LexA
LPIIGKIAAGSPIEAIESQESMDLVDWFLGPGRYALKVEGDSMIDEGIMHGDIIVCQTARTARNGQIVVALIDNEQATLKRIDYPDAEHICLIPANQNHQKQWYHASRVTIQGIFVGLLRMAS